MVNSMNNVDYVVICANQGVNKCNLLVHPDPGLNLPVQQARDTHASSAFINYNCIAGTYLVYVENYHMMGSSINKKINY